MTEPNVGPRCGNNPHVQLTPRDRQALEDFRAFLVRRAAEADCSQPTVSEADAERLATLADCADDGRGGLHCDHYQEGDGPCCACGRANWCPDGGVASPVGPAPATGRVTLRERIAHAIHRYDNHHALSGNDIPSRHHYGEADAILAVLPAAVDQTALERAANIAEDVAESLRKHHEFERSNGALDVMTELRRLAGEAQQERECRASISGSCLREAQSETACDTDDGECVYGGQPAREAQQDPTQDGTAVVDRRETVEYFVQAQQPDGSWEQCSSTATDREFATERVAARRRMQPGFTYRIAERTTTVVVRAATEPTTPARSGHPETDPEANRG